MVWAAIIIISIIIEAITVDLVSIWFALSAAVILVLEHILTLSIIYEIMIFIILSVLFILLTRPISKKILKGKIEKTNLDRVIGQECILSESITSTHKGKTVVLGKEWSATSLNGEIIEKGNRARVHSIEGNHLVLEEIS